MKFIPDGWSVDVDGNKVLVTFPAGDQSGRRLLSRHEARVLRLQLHLAYLLAGRNFWTSAAGTDATEGEADSFSALIRDRMKLQRVEISEDERAELLTQHQQGVERYREEIERAASCQTAGAKFVDWQNPEWDVLESQAKSSDEGGGGFPAGELPQGLSIEPIGATVKIIVPASAADGDFELTDSEALSAGVRLIQLCAIARSVRSAMEGAGSPSPTDPGGER